MVLFMTSSPCDDNVPEGVKLPCILFERNCFVKKMKQWWKPDSKGLIIAAYPDNYELNDEMRDTFYGAFTYHGMTFEELIMIDSRNDSFLEELIGDADFVMLAGGHVPTQNAYFEHLGLKKMLLHFDGIVMGISAGSMNCPEVVYAQPELSGESIDPDYERYLYGLGLCNVNILPHYNMVKDNILDGRRLIEDITFEDSMDESFIVLEDGSYVMIYDGVAEVYGKAYRISDGVMEQICEEEMNRVIY